MSGVDGRSDGEGSYGSFGTIYSGCNGYPHADTFTCSHFYSNANTFASYSYGYANSFGLSFSSWCD